MLQQIQLPFTVEPPQFNETREPGERPETMAIRLATGKAESVARSNKDATVIGSDQVVYLNGEIFGKPGSFEAAKQQLMSASGNWVTLVTSIVLMNKNRKITLCDTDEFSIRFRKLTSNQIESYLRTDKPYDCAGSIKAENLGISLIEDTRGKDINTLYGLPLILLTDLMLELGIDLISYPRPSS